MESIGSAVKQCCTVQLEDYSMVKSRTSSSNNVLPDKAVSANSDRRQADLSDLEFPAAATNGHARPKSEVQARNGVAPPSPFMADSDSESTTSDSESSS